VGGRRGEDRRHLHLRQSATQVQVRLTADG
jgi:hypothetical protein